MLKLLFGKLILAIISIILIVALILSLVYLHVIKGGNITSSGPFTAMFWFTLISSIIAILGLIFSVVLDLVYYRSNQSNQWFTISWIVTYGFIIFVAAYLASCAYIFYKASQGSISSTTAGDVFWFGLILTILFAISIIVSLILTGLLYSKEKNRKIVNFNEGTLVLPESLEKESADSYFSDGSIEAPTDVKYHSYLDSNRYRLNNTKIISSDDVLRQPELVSKPKTSNNRIINLLTGDINQSPQTFANDIGVNYQPIIDPMNTPPQYQRSIIPNV